MNSHRKLFTPLRWVQMIERNPLYSVKLWPWAAFLIKDLGEYLAILCAYWGEACFESAVSPFYIYSGCGPKDDRTHLRDIFLFQLPDHYLFLPALHPMCACTPTYVHIQREGGRKEEEEEEGFIQIPLTLSQWPLLCKCAQCNSVTASLITSSNSAVWCDSADHMGVMTSIHTTAVIFDPYRRAWFLFVLSFYVCRHKN